MPIDVSVKRSPGWWLQREFNLLNDRRRRRRLQLLHDYRIGNARLPEGAENARAAFEAFQKKARSNFAELINGALGQRMKIVGFRSALDNDETGDAEVGKLWKRAGLNVVAAKVHDDMLTMGEAYVIVGALDEETGAPLITAEDPRLMYGEKDPRNPNRLMAALKVLHDDAEDQDRAYLFLPGTETASGKAEVWVATRRRNIYDPPATAYRPPSSPMLHFTPESWDWDEVRPRELPHNRMPVVRFENKDGMGEFESHIDLLDRINHQILQRMVITVLQAFRQRAVKNLPEVDEQDQPVDYNDLFSADPGALWQLPEGAEMWESQQADLTPILSAVKDDVQHLAAVTSTPIYLLMPAGVNQSAEGASAQREGLISKADDRIDRTSTPWAKVMSLALLETGDTARADLSALETLWAPTAYLSLSEKAAAATQLAAVLPRRTLYITVLGMRPDEADRAMTELADDQLLAAQVAAASLPPATAAAAPGPAGTAGPAPRPAEVAAANQLLDQAAANPPARTPGSAAPQQPGR